MCDISYRAGNVAIHGEYERIGGDDDDDDNDDDDDDGSGRGGDGCVAHGDGSDGSHRADDNTVDNVIHTLILAVSHESVRFQECC